ncbi:G0/G1 switch protein 2 [Talpa occidentalis]|uniref:G0/G1 switch protein 2 n=1 Tax=Talpa occidentalis TaxID=50954 RepID=UPI00188E8324|nr:G0/G1 switch protein 2 [Talpa occidentalis]
METVQELIPLAKELATQKPNRKLVKLYVLGSVLAFVGALLGLVETVCSPFAAASRQREREAALAALRDARQPPGLQTQALLEKGKPEAVPASRAPVLRQHAS